MMPFPGGTVTAVTAAQAARALNRPHGGDAAGGSAMVTTTWVLVLALAVGLALVIELRGQ
jgi:hypothetical protein